MEKPYNWRTDYDWTDMNDGPASWEDDENIQDIILDQGISVGEQVRGPNTGIMQQASGINKDVLIKKVVDEFIKQKGRKPRSVEEIKEFYFEMKGNMAASADPILQDEYDKYVFDLQEQHPGATPMSIDDFKIQVIGEGRAGVRSGGLPGLLGV